MWSAALYQAAPRTTPPRPPSATFIGSVSDLYYLGSGFAMVAAAWPLQVCASLGSCRSLRSGYSRANSRKREAFLDLFSRDTIAARALLLALPEAVAYFHHSSASSYIT